MKTLQEYKNELNEQDQFEIISLFNITTEDLVDRFDDRIEDWYDQLVEETDDSEEDDV